MRVIVVPLMFFFAVIFARKTAAQILKVNKTQLEVDSSNFFQGSVNLNFDINNRSSTPEKDATFVGFKAVGDVVYFSEKHAYMLINAVDYFSVSDGPFISTGYAHFRINFMRKQKISVESFTQGQYDDGRNMPARFLQGTGLKFRLSRSEKLTTYLGTGIMWEYERWRNPNLENPIIEKKLFKTTNYFNMKFHFNENVNLNTAFYYQGGYDKEASVFRNRFNGDVNLTVKLTNRLAFLTSFVSQYEDKPIIPIEKFIYSISNGLQFNF